MPSQGTDAVGRYFRAWQRPRGYESLRADNDNGPILKCSPRDIPDLLQPGNVLLSGSHGLAEGTMVIGVQNGVRQDAREPAGPRDISVHCVSEEDRCKVHVQERRPGWPDPVALRERLEFLFVGVLPNLAHREPW